MVKAAGARVLTGRGGSGTGVTEAHSSTGLPEQSCVRQVAGSCGVSQDGLKEVVLFPGPR